MSTMQSTCREGPRGIFRGRVTRWAVAAALAAAAAVFLGASEANRGASSYTPTQGEWLCMSLNIDELFSETYRSPVVVRYLYDLARPDTIEIRVSYPPQLVTPEAVRMRVAQARLRTMEAAESRGWDVWLKLEVNVSEEPRRGV